MNEREFKAWLRNSMRTPEELCEDEWVMSIPNVRQLFETLTAECWQPECAKMWREMKDYVQAMAKLDNHACSGTIQAEYQHIFEIMGRFEDDRCHKRKEQQ